MINIKLNILILVFISNVNLNLGMRYQISDQLQIEEISLKTLPQIRELS